MEKLCSSTFWHQHRLVAISLVIRTAKADRGDGDEEDRVEHIYGLARNAKLIFCSSLGN